MIVNIYPSWECILDKLADLLDFQFERVGSTINSFGHLQNSYTISEKCFVRKSDLDDFIINGDAGNSDYARASVLYSLYACRHLVIYDIEYPTYEDWKKKYPSSSIDHKLPKKWFPKLTFDCTNWQPKTITDNKNKGDNFLEEGLERLQFLSLNLSIIKQKYM
jgi:hypothetical protein